MVKVNQPRQAAKASRILKEQPPATTDPAPSGVSNWTAFDPMLPVTSVCFRGPTRR
jgi:hypothetical protein